MSKLAKKPIIIPDGVTVKIHDRSIEVSGKTESLTLKLLEYINLEINGNQAIFKPSSMHKQARANWGTITSLFKNALQNERLAHAYIFAGQEGIGKMLYLQGSMNKGK